MKIENLLVGYSSRHPVNLNPWNFEIPEGELVAIVGPNGSGKSSLLTALMGEKTHLSGKVRILGEEEPVNLWSSKKLSHYFSYLPQESFFDPLQVTKHQLGLAFLPRLGSWGRVTEKQRAGLEDLVRKLELNDFLNKRLQNLSSGERQRVFLGRTILKPSKFLLLDEPTNHLDPDVQEKIWILLKQQTQKSKLVATHDLQHVERYCDRVIVLFKKEMVFAGKVSDYLKQGIKHRIFPLIY